MSFRERIEEIKRIRQEKLDGKWHYIPFKDHLPELAQSVPGIIPGTGYIITGATGSAKSKFLRFMFKIAYDFVKTHPNADFTFKFILNALEESPAEIQRFFIAADLKKAGFDLTSQDLEGFSDVPIPEAAIPIMEERLEYYEDVEKYLVLIDRSSPVGYYTKIRSLATQWGKFYRDDVLLDPNTMSAEEMQGWNRYELNNPNMMVMCANDHITLLSRQKEMSKYETLTHYSQILVRRNLNLKFGFTTFNVQQQTAETQKKQYTSKGANIEEKTYPTLDGLGEVKITANDSLIVFGLWNPYRYRIRQVMWKGGEVLDINKLKDNLRVVFVLKNRKGPEGRKIAMFFDGITEEFSELTPENLADYYRKCE